MELKTHDQQTVYPAGSPLPEGAHGWVRCWLRSGAYGTWLEPEDREPNKADMLSLEAFASKVRSHAAADQAFGETSRQSLPMRRMGYVIRELRRLWPLLETVNRPL